MEKVYTKNAPDAIGPYSQAVKVNGLVFTSGQIAINPATGNVEAATIEAQTEQVCTNLKNVLEASGSSLEKAVKTVCFLKNMEDFGAFNEVYGFYNLYRQDENDTKLILSVDNLDFDYISDLRFYDEYIYFVAGKRTSDKEDASTNLFLCKYNPNNGKLVYKIPYTPSSDFVKITCLSAVNDKIYGMIVNQSDNGYETVYCADLKNGTINTLFKSNAGMVINSYKDKVFLSVENGKDKGIYSIDTSTDKTTKIFNDGIELNGLYIVDSKYLYFTDNAYFNLYRITQDGKNLEKVFG